MNDSKNVDVETALSTGATAAVLLEMGIIGLGGFISGAVAELGTATGMIVFANMGAGAATLLDAAGPVG